MLEHAGEGHGAGMSGAPRLRRQRVVSERKKLELALKDRERHGVQTTTVERVLRADGRVIVGSNGCQFVNQSVLDTLFYKGDIDSRQFEAGDQFRSDAYRAGMVWSTTSLREPGSQLRNDDRLPFFTSRQEGGAFRRWSAAVSRISSEDARVLAAVVWPRETQICARTPVLNEIRTALDAVAAYYRLR